MIEVEPGARSELLFDGGSPSATLLTKTKGQPPDLFSEGGEVIKLHIQGSLTIPKTCI